MTTPPNEDDPRDQPLPGARLAEELRLLLDALAERAQPMVNRLAAADPDAEHTPATCGWCPVCAGMAVLRGERPELAVRAAEHAAGLLAVVRSALASSAPSPAASASPSSSPPPSPSPSPDRVQHITVQRRGGDD